MAELLVLGVMYLKYITEVWAASRENLSLISDRAVRHQKMARR